MKLLSIETSCDDTAISVIYWDENNLEDINNRIFSCLIDIKISQIDIHKQYGGVYPDIAKREHIKNLPIIITEINNKDPNILQNIDYIAVTTGPGLSPALWAGIEFAKILSAQYNNCPIYSINHLEGHIFSALLEAEDNNKYKLAVVNNSLAILVSGGHTEIVNINNNINQNNKSEYIYNKVGETVDDAAGECFDKSARVLNIPYPGGPVISQLASIARERGLTNKSIILPRPMINNSGLDFSFSGLKTAVIDRYNKGLIKTEDDKYIFAKEIEDAIVDVLINKLNKAITLYTPQNIILGGGVSANKSLRERLVSLCADYNINLFIPSITLAMDNSLMIATVAYYKIINNISPINITDIKANPRWRIDDK